jgi:16S rRNA (adenine1518-N6/adenine1519-N6)-dimethyltransferase
VAQPKKKWGQNFLRNRGAVERIVAAVEPQPGETIVEIGPGQGVLTEKLANLGVPLIAIEIDPDLAAALQSRFGSALNGAAAPSPPSAGRIAGATLNRVEIRNEDALEAPLPQTPFRAVGNLPYNAGTPILRRVIADPHCRRAVFMLQKEVADRLVAKPRDEQYGYLTLYTQLYAKARTLLTLDPRSFYPPPKVRSAVVVLDPVQSNIECDREELLRLISASFRMRRKKLTNNLTDWPRDAVLAAMKTAGIVETARAEELSLQEFDRLGSAIAKRES